MDEFARLNAGVVSPAEFFAPTTSASSWPASAALRRVIAELDV